MAEKELKAANISSVEEKVWVGGQTATQFDKRDTVKSDDFMIIPIIIVLISLLLLAYLRSVTAMVYLMGDSHSIILCSYGVRLDYPA